MITFTDATTAATTVDTD